jgi:hypothetical protein
MLSAKSSSPVERRREAIAESFLSVKASPRGKTRSMRVMSLSAKGLNPVVAPGRPGLPGRGRWYCTNSLGT